MEQVGGSTDYQGFSVDDTIISILIFNSVSPLLGRRVWKYLCPMGNDDDQMAAMVVSS
jgi:hypothetical protein